MRPTLSRPSQQPHPPHRDGCRPPFRAAEAGHCQEMTTDPSAADQPPRTDDAADDQVDAVDQSAFTERGDEAETSAFLDEGEYSGGDFAGGQVER